MTFLDLMNQFSRIRRDLDLTAADIGLFTMIALELNKARNENNDINGTQVKLGNPKLTFLAGISKSSLNTKRNKLKQIGLIDFKSGKGKGSYATYKLGELFNIWTVNDKPSNIWKENRTENRTENRQENRTRIKSKELRDKNIENTKEDTNVSSTPKIPFQEIKKLFNSICISQSKILKINPEREKHIRARWSWLDSLEKWESYFKKIEASTFLRDSSNKNWMDFDWVINETNMTKILEGKYDDKEVPDGGYRKGVRKANGQDFKNPAGTTTTDEELKKLLV